MYDPALGADADFEDLDPTRAEAEYERLLEECRLADKHNGHADLLRERIDGATDK
jgi:hypothetical protein